MLEFPISGVETWWWLPIVVSFGVSCITSTAGLSGAFVLLPFQVSVLGYTTPGVTPTNLLFNVFAIPGGVYRLTREKRMVWPLVWTMTIGTLPGLLVGVIIRVKYLPDPTAFKFFVGCVLLYIAVRLWMNVFGVTAEAKKTGTCTVIPRIFSMKEIVYEFNGTEYRVPTMTLGFLSAIVGGIGGIYGIGGGAILAPILVTLYGLPIHTVSGAALCSTFVTSVVGVLLYLTIGRYLSLDGQTASPDWLLGGMLGIGGFIGIYLGAAVQKYLPSRLIKGMLGVIMLYIAGRYIVGYFL